MYELTEWGLELEQVIMALGRWAARSPQLLQGHPLSIDALVLSFRTMFSSDAAEGLEASIGLRLGEERFHAEIAKGEMSLSRGSATDPGAILETDPGMLVAVVYGGRRFADAVKSGDLKVEGDKTIARRFVTLFPLPKPANAAT